MGATIFDRVRLGSLTLKNRVVRSATWEAEADERGYVTDGLVETYRELAAGGAGALISGLTSVAPMDAWLDGGARISDDSYIEGQRRLTDAVHAQGDVKVFLQAAMTASVSADRAGRLVSRDIDSWSGEEIRRIVGWFGDAARRAREAGYDGVQIHLAHFFFLSRFVSPLMNHRADKYGGSAEGRARIAIEVLRDMRAKAGDDFCVTAKVNSSDGHPGGVGLGDFLALSGMLADEGIDGIEVSANGTSVGGVRPGRGEAYFEDAAAALKRARPGLPVILVGGHRSVENMEKVLGRSGVELLSLSRPLIREPGLVGRWESGDLRPALCVSCNACYSTPRHKCVFNLRG